MTDDDCLAATELLTGFRAKSMRHAISDLMYRCGLRSNSNLLIEKGRSYLEISFVIAVRRWTKL